MTINVVVIGNCQSFPVSEFLKRSSNRVNILAVAGVDNAPENVHEKYEAQLKQADLIFTQSISDTYPVEWIRRGFLNDNYGGKLIFFPNHFFDGYCPEMCYIHDPDGRRHVLPGPLGDVHLKTVIHAYQQGLSQTDAIKMMDDEDLFAEHMSGLAQKSLRVLRRREVTLNVRISDYIAEHFRNRRLFYTFNHPTTALLGESCKRMLQYAGVSIDYDISEIYGQELLAVVIKSVPRPVYHEQGMTFNNPPYHRGVSLARREDGDYIIDGHMKFYNNEELVAKFYEVYENNHDRVMKYPIQFEQIMA